jgi:anti-sigma-K factor RskA
LRARVLEAAAAERRSALPQAVRRPWLLRAAVAAAAVATCAAVGLGIWAALLYRSADQERSARTAVASALDILTNPASRRVPLAGRDGVVAVEPSGQAVLVVRRLPPAPAGQTYEAWVIPRGGAPVPAGLFDGGGATTVVRLREAVPSGAVVAATVERAGGAKAPTQTPILHAGI